jgi:hypothetical protein
MSDLLQRYADRIVGCLSCFDRLIIWGTLVRVSHAPGLCQRLKELDVPLAQFAQFAMGQRDALEQHLVQLAATAGVEIEYLKSARAVRKEERVQEVLAQRGDHPGLVHIFTVVEPARVFEVRPGRSGGPHLIARRSKCKQYYLYFLDPQFGLCHLRISTWLPFWVQFYCNGHAWLARALAREGISFTLVDNAFTACGDWARAQALAEAFPVKELHQALDGWMAQYFPVCRTLEPGGFHWSITQAEYATDVVFRSPADLRTLYGELRRHAIHTVRATDIATFLQHRLPPDWSEAEIGSNLRTTLEGTRVRHQWSRDVSLKLYDKHGVMLRIETTTSDVSFFRHHREVVHRDGTSSLKLAPMQKTLYSLPLLGTCLGACNRRYLTFLAALEEVTPGLEAAEQLAEPVREHERSYRGFNLLARSDLELFVALTRGEWCIRGFKNGDLRRLLSTESPSRISNLLRRLQMHRLITRVTKSYRYRLTELGQRVVTAALRLRQFQVAPHLAGL